MFLFSSIGISIGLGLAVLALARWWPAAALAAVVGATDAVQRGPVQRNRRIGAFEEMLPEAIDLLGRAIRAGHPLSAGMKMVADETKDPIARRIPPDARGAPLRPAVRGCAPGHGGPGEPHRRSDPDDRHPDSARGGRQPGRGARQPGQRRSGCASPSAGSCASTPLRGGSAATCWVRCPIAVGLAIYSLNPSYIRLLFTDPLGKLMVLIAFVFQIAGFLWIRKIVNIEI